MQMNTVYHESFVEEKFRGIRDIREIFIHWFRNMALFKYSFKQMRDEVVLLDPLGELSRTLALEGSATIPNLVDGSRNHCWNQQDS